MHKCAFLNNEVVLQCLLYGWMTRGQTIVPYAVVSHKQWASKTINNKTKKGWCSASFVWMTPGIITVWEENYMAAITAIAYNALWVELFQPYTVHSSNILATCFWCYRITYESWTFQCLNNVDDFIMICKDIVLLHKPLFCNCNQKSWNHVNWGKDYWSKYFELFTKTVYWKCVFLLPSWPLFQLIVHHIIIGCKKVLQAMFVL